MSQRKRRVKAWLIVAGERDDQIEEVHFNEKEARRYTLSTDWLIPCTIEYTPPTPPVRRPRGSK